MSLSIVRFNKNVNLYVDTILWMESNKILVSLFLTWTLKMTILLWIFFLVLFLFADLNEIHELQKTVDIRGNLAKILRILRYILFDELDKI
jgi:hypothetical protein